MHLKTLFTLFVRLLGLEMCVIMNLQNESESSKKFKFNTTQQGTTYLCNNYFRFYLRNYKFHDQYTVQ